ncbi:DUF624 domain-containing protein [Cryobacterium lactosi]|uniref:DUF624 domain-containing protein n=1 Tax=Cryobacterium lactosi TaxID=1259202 RepID=A0A4R9BWF7_9MICO|nr:DUF624 domain-containing protein [Cryobacterium lactosi]TFD92668.1 DUF624 domain-containing protein [Cryobacterium lactosi]
MTLSTGTQRTGTLGRATAMVYRVLILELLFLAAASPGLGLLVTLSGDASNAPLLALCLLPVGPALSALIFAWRQSPTEDHLEPARHFWRGYRLNTLGMLRWWWLVLVTLGILGINVAYLDVVIAPGVPLVIAGLVQAAVFTLVAVVALHALIIGSLYNFRARDVLRLALRCVREAPRATLGAAAITIASIGVVSVGSEVALIALGSILAAVLLNNAKPMTTLIEEKYIA